MKFCSKNLEIFFSFRENFLLKIVLNFNSQISIYKFQFADSLQGGEDGRSFRKVVSDSPKSLAD